MFTGKEPFKEFKKEDKPIEYKVKGKWLLFFNDFDFADRICQQSVDEGVVLEANHSIEGKYGVCRFFIEAKDLKQHKKILRFLINNDYIPRTKKENDLYDIAFKLQLQTDNLEYIDSGFMSLLNLHDLVDLQTGEFLDVDDSVFRWINEYLKEEKLKKRKKKDKDVKNDKSKKKTVKSKKNKGKKKEKKKC